MQITDGTQTILGGDDNLCGRATMLNGAIRFNNSVCATDAEGIGQALVNFGAYYFQFWRVATAISDLWIRETILGGHVGVF